ncbi:hypothetical protein TcBrA4_0102470 [Trypanosoma cruzi]|nr:hypothetical protein TcBrA4_0102470 [Trypanosoma cruzi]
METNRRPQTSLNRSCEEESLSCSWLSAATKAVEAILKRRQQKVVACWCGNWEEPAPARGEEEIRQSERPRKRRGGSPPPEALEEKNSGAAPQREAAGSAGRRSLPKNKRCATGVWDVEGV